MPQILEGNMLAVENFPEASRESLKVGEGVLRPANNTNKIADEAHRLPALLLPPLPGLVSEAARGPPDAVAESDIDNGDILFFGDRLHKLGKAGQGCTSLRLRGAEGEGPSTTTTTRRPRRALEAEPRLLGAKRWTWTPRGSVPDSYPPMPDGPSTPDRPEKASSIPFGEGLVDSHPQLKPPLSKRLAKNARSSWGSATAGIFKAFLAGEDSPARPRTPSPAIGREFTADLPSDGSNINVVGRRLKKCATWAAASEFEELLRDGPGASAAPAGPIEPHGRGVRTASSRFNRDKTPSKLRRGWLFPGRQLPDDDSDDFPNMPVRIGSDWVQFQPVAGLDQVSKAYYQQPRNPSPERAVESRRARYTYTTPRFPVKFHGPLLAMFEDGLVTSPKSCNDLEWKVFMGFCPSWPNSTAENTGLVTFWQAVTTAALRVKQAFEALSLFSMKGKVRQWMLEGVCFPLGHITNTIGLSWKWNHEKNLQRLDECVLREMNCESLSHRHTMLHKSFSRINELLAMALRSKRATSDELKKASKMYQQAYDFLLENAWLDLTEVLFFYRKHLVESQYICVGHNNALHPTSSDIDLQEEAVKLLAGFTPARQRPERFQCMGHPHVFSRIQVNHTGAHFFNSFMKGLDSVVALTT